jgi:hypothetical protein
MNRMRFERGVSSLEQLVGAIRLAFYLAIVAAMTIVLWPALFSQLPNGAPLLSAPLIWLLGCATLSGPAIAAVLWLPFTAIINVIRGFVIDKDDGISSGEWQAIQVHHRVMAVVGYLGRLLTWAVILLGLYALRWLADRDNWGPHVTRRLVDRADWVVYGAHWLTAHFIWVLAVALVVGYPLVRGILWMLIDVTAEIWIERHLAREHGPQLGERYRRFSLQIRK